MQCFGSAAEHIHLLCYLVRDHQARTMCGTDSRESALSIFRSILQEKLQKKDASLNHNNKLCGSIAVPGGP